jgi:Pyruvate/2-oxoacid:ferredoxin oxidoreductase delta subunit
MGGEDNIYKRLAEHLDQAPIGAPMSEELVEILRILYTPEEAKIACSLPFSNTGRDQLAEKYGMDPEEMGRLLDGMVAKGTVFRKGSGPEAKYRLLPTLVGFSETPFWPGKDNEVVRKLSPLWISYWSKAWGKEIADRKTPLVRVVPVEEEVVSSSRVMPYETTLKLVAKADYIAVAYCPCRQMKAYVGQGCEHERENCFHFGSMGRFIVEQGMGRELTLEEAVLKLKEAHEEGLVFSTDNYQGKISTLCTCCGCCCIFLQSRKVLGYNNAIAPSNYAARVDEDSCIGCATCEGRCPVGAVKLGDDEVARVEEARCLGCGVCVPTCEGKAISLWRRTEVRPVPTLEEFLMDLIDS